MGSKYDARTITVLTNLGIRLKKSESPVFVHVVANQVVGDSRVIKSAQVSSELGFSTVILGITREDEPIGLALDGATAVLVPLLPHKAFEKAVRRWRQWTFRIKAVRLLDAVERSVRRRSARPWRVAEPSPPSWSRGRRQNLRVNVAFADALDALKPSVVHVHDTGPLPAAVAFASANRLRRRKVELIYDAHECVPEQARVFAEAPFHQTRAIMEENYIHDADQVITVSTQIAELLQKTYELRSRPSVVTNAPSSERAAQAPHLRERIGLSSETPLAVYSGWVAEVRGVDDTIKALVELPELHLALVTNPKRKHLLALTRLAHRLGVFDRVHYAPYVPPSQVTEYLASADIGLIPLKPGRHFDLSLPTKYREYLHAGLPLVVSSNEAMATEVRRTGVGEVFHSGSVTDLAQALGKVLARPSRYRDSITAEVLKENSWETQREVLRQCYRTGSRHQPDQRDLVDIEKAVREELQHRFIDHTQKESAEPPPRVLGVSLLIGATSHAAEAVFWREVCQRELGVPAECIDALTGKPHRSEGSPFTDTETSNVGLDKLHELLDRHTHVVYDAFAPLFGKSLGNDMSSEIAALREIGIQAAIVVQADDVTVPGADSQLSSARTAVALEQSTSNREFARNFAGPVLVSSLGLADGFPGARWLPLPPDSTMMALPPQGVGRSVPRVAQLADRSGAATTSSKRVASILQELHNRGIIEHVDHPSHAGTTEVRSLISQSDVLIDGFDGGACAAAAIAAMASGRIVVGHVGPRARALVDDELPIVEAKPENLAVVLTELASQPTHQMRLAEAGLEFVRKWHSGRHAAEVIEELLRS